MGGGRWKSQNRKIVPLSPYVEKPLSFVPELRSRYVFFEFRDSYVLSLWTFDVRFTHNHIMAMVQVLLRCNRLVPGDHLLQAIPTLLGWGASIWEMPKRPNIFMTATHESRFVLDPPYNKMGLYRILARWEIS